MPSTALPAREILKPPGETTVAWVVFDADWYLTTYPDVRTEIGAGDAAAVMAFYLDHGQQRGHSPNIYFDEAWHIKNHAGAASAVREGHAESGFDAYCRAGFRFRSPHWLFSEALYRQRHPDLRDEVLQADDNANGYDHYLKHGSREGRIGHLLFDPAVYLAQLDQAERQEAVAAGPFPHYLRRIAARRSEVRTSVYFDPIWYLQQYPNVAKAIEQGEWQCALHHYLCNDTPAAFDPLAEFSETDYLTRYPDIAGAVETKERRNGYDHFLSHGVLEQRSPNRWIDLQYYLTTHASVRADLEQGRARDALAHYLTIGRAQGLQPAPPPDEQVTEQQASALFRRKANNLLPTAARIPVDFTCGGTPSVSVIAVLHDEFPQALMMLSALRAHYPGDIELVLIDSGSVDEAGQIGRYVRGARVMRFDSDIGLVRARNAALNCATADAVLFLSNEVELAPGTIAAALHRLASDARIGVVGGKVIRANGKLQEAGRIIWRDGFSVGYLESGSPLAPEANFVRDVDFCASEFLLVRAALLRQLEGFDDALEPGGYDDADLCVRIAEAGQRVVYDPAVVIYHHGAARLGAAAGTAAGAVAAVDQAHQAFFRKHINHLRFRYIADSRVQVFARSTDTGKRVLFIDDTIPLRMIGSGFVRSNDILHVMASLGYRVTVFPVNSSRFGLASIYADMPDTVEVMHDRGFDGLTDFLTARQGYYDAIWIARTHNLDRIRPILERMTSGSGRPPRIVLDTEAIVSMRDAARATLLGEIAVDVDAAIMQEFANAHFCQSIIAVNPDEAQKLRDLGFSDVAVIGHLREPRPTPRGFAERAGLLFVGAMHRVDSPNYDALVWFVREVLPLVEQKLGWETRLTVAGYTDAQVSLEQFREHPRITLRGAVPDIDALYDWHRIFVAPTRYAAGVPYKVHEAASHGIPVVATELLRQQLGWVSGRDLLSVDVGDAAAFAQAIVSLYRDADLWQTLRDNALERVRVENGRAPYEAAIQGVLGG
jgi:O-antigen biosynthesis protein